MSVRGAARASLLLAGVLLAVAGCAQLDAVTGLGRTAPGAGQVPGPWPGTPDVRGLVRYANALHQLSPEALAAEHRRARSAAANDDTGLQQIRLALLLSQPAAPFRDEPRAQGLLSRYLEASGGDDDYRDFATFVLGVLEQRRQRRAEYERLQEALARERAERAELGEKIEALKAIEKNLNRHDTGSGDSTP